MVYIMIKCVHYCNITVYNIVMSRGIEFRQWTIWWVDFTAFTHCSKKLQKPTWKKKMREHYKKYFRTVE